jgi:two-component system, chemotaxis family, CheB/CheR fusion protein
MRGITFFGVVLATPKKTCVPAVKRAASIKKSSKTAIKKPIAVQRQITSAPFKEMRTAFPIVGLGASAGGLEALELFLKNVPPASGLAYVVVQHLDPTHKGILVELLQRCTSMPVVQIKDRMPLQPNQVYVIAPNRDLSLLHGVLHLLEPAAPRGLRLPIDYFLRSLAADSGDRSVGVILSGMGSDGSLGLRAIKEHAGAVFVQTPSSAKFDGMPRSAIDAGLADVIAPPQDLPGKIIDFVTRPSQVVDLEQTTPSKDQSALEKIIILLRAHTRHDFSHYKKSSLYRRIERRMSLHQLAKIADYVRYLQSNPQELDLLFKELLIGVTSFFRDAAVWTELKDKVFPALLANRAHGGVLRAWIAGCSTGEEAYSLAMCFREVLDAIKVTAKPVPKCTLMIFATDLDKDAIDRARTGIYPANIAADVSDERLHRFFTEDERGYHVNKEIREMVIFAPQDLIMDPPFTKLDIVSCRNVLIYMDIDLQKKIMALFHYSLHPSGILLLGSAETVGTAIDLFEPLSGKLRLYHRLNSARARESVDFPAAFAPRLPETAQATASAQAAVLEAMPPAVSLQMQADHFLLRHYAPPAVLVTAQGDIVYVSGKTGKYLEPAVGRANFNVFAMARDGLRHGLSEALRKALHQKTVVTLRGMHVGTNGGTQSVDVSVHPLAPPHGLSGMVMVVFTDAATPAALPVAVTTGRATAHRTRIAALERQLQDAYTSLEEAHQQMQTSQEELKSTNEEMQSTNEELQSTNEELTTSKEEMQSMNEELQTVNHELQTKVDELSRISDDMSNLLNSTEIATLFLDEALNVRRYTAQTTKIIKLIAGDVGRPITDIVTDMDYPALAHDVREVLRTLIFCEKQISASNGRWFLVRIMPYRTQQNRIQGAVITFSDISAAKHLEAQLRKTQLEREQRIALSLPGENA